VRWRRRSALWPRLLARSPSPSERSPRPAARWRRRQVPRPLRRSWRPTRLARWPRPARDEAVAARIDAETARAEAESARAAADAARASAVEEREAAQAQVDALVARTDALTAQVVELEAETQQLERVAERLTAEAVGCSRRTRGCRRATTSWRPATTALSGRNVALQELNVSLQAEILAGNEQVRAAPGPGAGAERPARRPGAAPRRGAAGVLEGGLGRDHLRARPGRVLGALCTPRNRPRRARSWRRSCGPPATTRRSLGAGEVVLNAEQFAGLAEVIAETEGSDLVRLISPRNQFNPARVEVHRRGPREHPAVRGRAAADVAPHPSRHAGPTGHPGEVRDWIAQFRADVIRSLRRTGLDELQAPIFVGSATRGSPTS
jgi:hypothetical protein